MSRHADVKHNLRDVGFQLNVVYCTNVHNLLPLIIDFGTFSLITVPCYHIFVHLKRKN